MDNNPDNEDVGDILVPVLKAFALLGVNADPESYIFLECDGSGAIDIKAGFSLDKEETGAEKEQLLRIFDGGKNAMSRL